MKVFADTNLLVSAFATRGLSADAFQAVLASHELITGEFVIDELRRVLRNKLKVPAGTISEIEKLLRRHTVVAIPDAPSSVKVRDEDNRWVLASALESEAELLVTGDKDLLSIRHEVIQLQVVRPRELWEMLQQKE